MTEKKLGRRNLLGLRRPPAPEGVGAPQNPPAPPRRDAFSLDAFYAGRAASTEAHEPGLRAFELRPGLPQVETVSIGTPELSALPRSALSRQHVATAPIDGIVRIETGHCLAWQHSFCSVCSEHCPQPGAIVCEQGRPMVAEDACTGCGICVQVCPAPINAFVTVARPPTPRR
jgi:Pyruvate/2-oxoacid:ferredoxin oxidoreductase delta subunit